MNLDRNPLQTQSPLTPSAADSPSPPPTGRYSAITCTSSGSPRIHPSNCSLSTHLKFTIPSSTINFSNSRKHHLSPTISSCVTHPLFPTAINLFNTPSHEHHPLTLHHPPNHLPSLLRKPHQNPHHPSIKRRTPRLPRQNAPHITPGKQILIKNPRRGKLLHQKLHKQHLPLQNRLRHRLPHRLGQVVFPSLPQHAG